MLYTYSAVAILVSSVLGLVSVLTDFKGDLWKTKD